MAAVRRIDWHERIKAVGREYEVARQAVEDYAAALQRGDAELPPQTTRRDANTMAENLEGTYLIRLFAAFETGLRSYWQSVRDTVPLTRVLIDSIAARHEISLDWCDAVHQVREYRNSLVHESDEQVDPISLADAQGRLSRFFSKLPFEWNT
jgi:hypothetical protein